MRIGINTRFLLNKRMEGFGWYTYEVTKRLVEQHPEHEFVLFFDRPFDPKFVFGPNATPVVLFPQARHPLLFVWWFNWSITKALKKYKCDVFFSPDGYLSLRTDVPQIPVIHDLNFEYHPEDLQRKHRNYYRKYFPKFAKKANHIVTVSAYSKQDIVKLYTVSPDKITVAWNGAADGFVPLKEAEIQAVRKQYSNGKPYFIFVGSLHPRKNLKTLIEAFTKFAATNAEIDLLIVGKNLWRNASEEPTADVLKFQNRIHFTGHVPFHELTKITGSAFALTYIPYFEGFGIPLVEAMKCGLPVISGNRTSLPEVAGDAAIYVDPMNANEVSAEMLRLTSDQELYTELKQKSLERSNLFSWDNTANGVWEVILKVLKRH